MDQYYRKIGLKNREKKIKNRELGTILRKKISKKKREKRNYTKKKSRVENMGVLYKRI